MPDEQDKAEALDDDKLDLEPASTREVPPGRLIDQTADADGGFGAAEIDAGESGDEMDGVFAEQDSGGPLDPPDDREVLPAEEAAMHIVDE